MKNELNGKDVLDELILAYHNGLMENEKGSEFLYNLLEYDYIEELYINGIRQSIGEIRKQFYINKKKLQMN